MRVPGLQLDVNVEELAWRATSVEGVAWLPLHLESEAGGHSDQGVEGSDATVLIRMDPGCSYPAHRHDGIEEVLILAGGYRDESGEHRAGSYLRYEAGSRHAPVALGDSGRPAGADNPACVLFAVARGGVSLCEEG